MPNKVAPIKASEISDRRDDSIPDEVIASFNELITKNWRGHSATVRKDDAIRLIVSKGLKQSDIFENGWLDVMDIFRKNGWHVEFDSPGYDESYEPFFIFKNK